MDFGAEKRNRPGRDILAEGGAAIESFDAAVLSRQVNNVRIRGIDNHVPALAWSGGKPVGRPNSPPGAATVNCNTAAVLLRSINRIGILIIGRDVIKLRRRLVVPGAPGLSPIQADRRSLVGSEYHSRRIFGVDPDLVIVVAAGRTAHNRNRLASVFRAIQCNVGNIQNVRITRVDGYAVEVPGTTRKARIIVDEIPVLTAII